MTRLKTKFTPDTLERRALDALRSAGGSMMRSPLKLAVKSNMRATEFDRLMRLLIGRGLVEVKQSMHAYAVFERRHERMCTVYTLVTPTQEQHRDAP